MKIFYKVFHFYIHASIHVSLCVVAFAAITLLEYEAHFATSTLLFLFFATITGYNFIKFAEVARLHHRSLAGSLRTIQLFSFFCFIGLLATLFYLKFETLFLVCFLGLGTLLYALPIFSNRRNLRTIASVKIFVIAIVWSGSTVFVPILENRVNVTHDLWITALQRFLMVLVLILPFEIRDMKYDAKQLRTVPQMVGLKATKRIGWILLLGICLLDLTKDTLVFSSVVGLWISALLLGILLAWSSENQPRYFASFWVESIPLLYLGMVLLLTLF